MAILTGVVALTASALLYPPGVSYRLIVRDFRFRKDDGSESDASWAAPLNTNLPDIDSSENYRIRFSIENVGLSDDSPINQGHLEVSEDGGAYKTMGMDAFTSPVVIPPHTLGLVSTITDANTHAGGALLVDSNGIWHLAYTSNNDPDREITMLASITGGQTWRKHTFAINFEEALSITEAPNGDIVVLTSSYTIRSTTSGLTWETPLARPTVSGTAIFGFFITSNNDYIIAEGFAMKYHISADEGITWSTYQNTDFPASLLLADIYYELDTATGDLTLWYAGYTSGGVDPISMFRLIDTYPYSGFPNAAEDDISQRLFIGSGGFANPYHSFVFVRSYSGMNLILYSSVWDTVPPIAIVETATDNFEFKNLDYISQTWDDTAASDTAPRIYNTVLQGRAGAVAYNTYTTLSFSGNTYDFAPGFMGTYEFGNANMSYVHYSPAANKWYGVEVTFGVSVKCHELEWSQVPDGTHTTQQISSGSFADSNYGYTHHNMIRGSAGTDVAAGEKVEYEYAFRLRPSEDIAGKTVCLRPSGFGEYDNVACFTIPVGVCYMDASATMTVSGDTDGPKCSMEVAAGFKVLISVWDGGVSTWDSDTSVWDYFPTQYTDAEILRGAVMAPAVSASISVSANVTKYGAINLSQPCGFTGLAWVEHAAVCNMLVVTNLTLASTNTKLVTTNISVVSTFTGGAPNNEIHVRAVLQNNSALSPTARKELHAATSLHTRSLLGIQSSPDELHIDLVIYEEEPESILATIVGSIWDAGVSVWDVGLSIWDAELPIEIDVVITQDKPLTIVNIPARLTVIQAPEPDLVIIQQPPLRVYI